LAILGQNKTYILCFLALTSSLSKDLFIQNATANAAWRCWST